MILPYLLSEKKPLFSKEIFVTRPNLPSIDELTPHIKNILQKRWVTNFGSYHTEFENEIKKRLRVKYVVPCCNGTIALFLLLKALELKGKVITTPFTFPATVHAITMAGLAPLLCDINPDTYTMETATIEKNISPSVSAILAVNIFGVTCDIQKLNHIGSKYKIPVIYDSAHALFSKYDGKYVGNFGTAEIFSFHATKLFSTVEGGAITTNDNELYNKLKLLINFGIKDEENVVYVGLNGKMSELNAIFGILSFRKIERILRELAILSNLYREKLADIPGIKLQKISKNCSSNNQYMPIEIIEEQFGMNRDQLYLVLKKDNIFARKYFYPAVHQYECYEDAQFTKNVNLPNTDSVTNKILCLPMYASLEVRDVIKICSLIKSIHTYSEKILEKLKNI